MAVALSNLNGIEGNLEVDIYESAPELTQVGAGITIWPRTWKILEKFGLTEELLTHLAPGQHIPDGVPRACLPAEWPSIELNNRHKFVAEVRPRFSIQKG